MDVGTGDWDRERRPSEVRLDRVIVLDEGAIRREGAALDQAMFDRVVAAARQLHALDSTTGRSGGHRRGQFDLFRPCSGGSGRTALGRGRAQANVRAMRRTAIRDGSRPDG